MSIRIEVADVAGKIIYRSSEADRSEIDLHSPSGTYLTRITTADGLHTTIKIVL